MTISSSLHKMGKCNCILLLLTMLSTSVTHAESAYPRSAETFVHIADYGSTVVMVERYLRAFDVLAFSVLTIAVTFVVFTLMRCAQFIFNGQKDKHQDQYCRNCDEKLTQQFDVQPLIQRHQARLQHAPQVEFAQTSQPSKN